MPEINNLQRLLRLQRTELISAFERASIEGQGTPQEIADRRESALHAFLKSYFPFPYQVAKGNISDPQGRRSQSIDALVINPSHPHTVNREQQYSFIMADGVDYAIELKPNLADRSELERSLRQIRSVKQLRRQSDGILLGRQRLTDHQRDLALQVPSIIFGHSTWANIETLIECIADYYNSEATPVTEQFDILCLLDGTIVVNSSSRLHFNVGVEGLVYRDFGEDVLYYFFYFLCEIPQSTPSMKKNILHQYVQQPPREGWLTHHTLNPRMRPQA